VRANRGAQESVDVVAVPVDEHLEGRQRHIDTTSQIAAA
jgi:hypothetical protein